MALAEKHVGFDLVPDMQEQSSLFEETLLVSCPNQGGLVLVHEGKILVLDYRDSTGLAIHGDKIARCILASGRASLQLLDAEGVVDLVFGDELDDPHDLIFHNEMYYLVSTGTNTVLRISDTGELLEKYVFPGEGDAWHLNCLFVVEGRVIVSAFGEFSEHRGYKGHTIGAGFLFDLETREKIWEGLSQPHSPVVDGENIYLCDSETKRLLVRQIDGTESAYEFDGYARGLAVGEKRLYLGLSLSRNIEQEEGVKGCRIVAIDRATGKFEGQLELPFREIYSVVILQKELVALLFAVVQYDRDNCRLRLSEAECAEKALERLNRHPIVGLLVRLLRRLKKDPSFGAGKPHA